MHLVSFDFIDLSALKTLPLPWVPQAKRSTKNISASPGSSKLFSFKKREKIRFGLDWANNNGDNNNNNNVIVI